jgi:hypothetical protein
MIGYHYTSYDHWRKIQQEGLVPYRIDADDLLQVLNLPYIDGMWVWARQLYRKAHIGSLLYHALHKYSTHLVLLQVVYTQNDMFQTETMWQPLSKALCVMKNDPRDAFYCYHDFPDRSHPHIGLWHDKEPGVILSASIPPESITLIGDYDLRERLAP